MVANVGVNVLPTSAVDAQVCSGVGIAGVTGSAPWAQRAARCRRLAILESGSEDVGVCRVGVTGPAAALAFTQVCYGSTPPWSINRPASSLLLLQPQRPPLARFCTTTYRERCHGVLERLGSSDSLETMRLDLDPIFILILG